MHKPRCHELPVPRRSLSGTAESFFEVAPIIPILKRQISDLSVPVLPTERKLFVVNN
jgi:hypothetical protein